jgi:hypothetical protein
MSSCVRITNCEFCGSDVSYSGDFHDDGRATSALCGRCAKFADNVEEWLEGTTDTDPILPDSSGNYVDFFPRQTR